MLPALFSTGTVAVVGGGVAGRKGRAVVPGTCPPVHQCRHRHRKETRQRAHAAYLPNRTHSLKPASRRGLPHALEYCALLSARSLLDKRLRGKPKAAEKTVFRADFALCA